MGANLLPCNAAVPVASPDTHSVHMSPLEQLDRELEKIIRELTLRIVAPHLTEFECVWEAANEICDRYEIAKAG
jgi:hypothetical protein